MDINKIKIGLMIKIVRDNGTRGMLIKSEILSRRGVSKQGIVRGYVPGHGGDVWFVEHSEGIAAYCYDEIEIVKNDWLNKTIAVLLYGESHPRIERANALPEVRRGDLRKVESRAVYRELPPQARQMKCLPIRKIVSSKWICFRNDL